MISYETLIGRIEISEAYLSKLIGHEVTSCFGVFNLLSRREQINTGIRVYGDNNSIRVELHITVVYGMNINAIASSITEKVKYVVEDTTGITVEKVIVKIDDIKE